MVLPASSATSCSSVTTPFLRTRSQNSFSIPLRTVLVWPMVYFSAGFSAFGALAAFVVSFVSTSFAARFFASLVPCFFIGVLLLSDWGSEESCPERERFDTQILEGDFKAG